MPLSILGDAESPEGKTLHGVIFSFLLDELLTYCSTNHFTCPQVYFVVMENVLQLDVHMHRSYDLKGSSQGRTISKYSDHKRATFKDLDLDFIFYLNPQTRHKLLE